MDIVSILSKHKRVIIYGAGTVGRTVVEKLTYENPEIDILIEF